MNTVGTFLKKSVSHYFGVVPTAPPIDVEQNVENIYPQLEPYDLPAGYEFGQQKLAPSFANLNVPELLENVSDYLGMLKLTNISDVVENETDSRARPKPRGRNDGGRVLRRAEERRKLQLYQNKPEELDKLADESMKNQYKVYIEERKQRLKWISTTINLRQSFFMGLSIVLMIVLYVWEVIYNEQFNTSMTNPWLWGSVSPNTLLDCGGKYAPLIVRGEWWRLITSMFIHVSLPHFIINIITQLKVGLSVEKQFGAKRIIPVYFISGIGGNVLSCIFIPETVTGGASGALFGLHGLLFVDLFKNWKDIVSPFRELVFLFITTVILFLTGFLPGVDNFTHIGALFFGVLAGVLFIPSRDLLRQQQETKTPKSRWITIVITLIIVVVLFIILFVILFTAVPSRNWCVFCESVNCIRSWFGDWCGRDAFPSEETA